MTTDRILFAEWDRGAMRPGLLGDGSGPGPCPLCGMTNCTHDPHTELERLKAMSQSTNKGGTRKGAATTTKSAPADTTSSETPAGGSDTSEALPNGDTSGERDTSGDAGAPAAEHAGPGAEASVAAAAAEYDSVIVPKSDGDPEEQTFTDVDAELAKQYEGREEIRSADFSDPLGELATIPASAYTVGEGADQLVTLDRDVVEEFYFPDTRRPSHRLLFAKGQVVKKSEIDAMDARVEAARAVARGDFEIDSSTRQYQAGGGDSNVDAIHVGALATDQK